MKTVSPTIAQYGGLWSLAVIEAGKKDCTPSLVLVDSIRRYRNILNKKSKTKEEEEFINTHKEYYENLRKPKSWRLLTVEEKLDFCADYAFNQAIKMPYVIKPSCRNKNLLDISVRTYDFGDYIIKAQDGSGKETPLRSLASFDCCALTLQLDKKLIDKIKTNSKGKYADYIRRYIFRAPLRQLSKMLGRKINYSFVVENNKNNPEFLHIHGIFDFTAEELSLKIRDSERKVIENIFLEGVLGKEYNSHPLVKTAVKIDMIHHPLGWADYMSKDVDNRDRIYISRKVLQEGAVLYNEYRKEVISLNETLLNLKRSPRKA